MMTSKPASGPQTLDVVTGAFLPAMDPTIKTIQPGGGVIMFLELKWGRLRRALLRKFRPRYVARLADRRQGHAGELPFEPIDSRDMKYFRNQGSYWWADADDTFMWRDSLPFVRVALAELLVLGGACLCLAAMLGWWWWPLALPGIIGFGLVAWFFRDPKREIPEGPGNVVAPADGKLVEISEIDDPVIGPAVRFRIFLSMFDARSNRVPLPGRVVSVRYRPGKSVDALRSASAKQNENLDIELACPEIGGQIIRIRQVTGQFAKRIVCWARVDDFFERGEMYGMIKLGSRTELVVPRNAAFRIQVQVGDQVSAGSTTIARYDTEKIPAETQVSS